MKPSPSLRIRAATAKYPNLVVVYQSKALLSLYTIMRDKNTSHRHFTAAADRVLRLLAEEGLAEVRSLQHVSVQTPVGPFEGLKAREDEDICVVSIVRAGDTLQEAIRLVSPGALLGKILIQRDEDTPEKHPKLFFTKLPPSSKMKKVLLVDPMLATGQSCILAIKELLRVGVKEEDITFLNLLACPEGLDTLFSHYPQVRVVTGAIDEGLNEHMYIVPGLGDYGDRKLSSSFLSLTPFLSPPKPSPSFLSHPNLCRFTHTFPSICRLLRDGVSEIAQFSF